jgi:3-dehydroquinate synthase
MITCLESQPETIYRRLLDDTTTSGPLRPLLVAENPLQRIKYLKEFRQPYYAIADWTVHTDNLSLDEVCQEVIRGWQYWSRAHQQEDDLALRVITSTSCYPIFVGWGSLRDLGRRMHQVALSGKAFVISDEQVFSLYGAQVEDHLQDAGFTTSSIVVPPGEATKSLDSAVKIYHHLVQKRAERKDVIVALGGGMVGDLAGFVAATFLRGLPLVQLPTSLVAMVDAAIGGKTAVNHPQAKNIIGAFYQPRLVLADVHTLTTLPHRELISGWAEVTKHSLILDAAFFQFLEDNVDRLTKLDPELLLEAIKRSVAIKAKVVSEDEKETGRRTLLNYGHTIAHGLEAATDYERFLHGEAVAIGMMGAAMLSERMGILEPNIVKGQKVLLSRFGLPTSSSGIELARLLQAMGLDKKITGGKIRWVLLQDIGQAVIRDDVPPQLVSNVLNCLIVEDRGNA